MDARRIKKYKQVGSLYVSMALGLVVGIGVSVINTRFLGAAQYGDLKFLQSLFSLFATLFTFGFFDTGSHLLAKERHGDSSNNVVIGNLLVVASAISILVAALLVVFSYYQERIFDNELGSTIRLFAPLFFVFPFQMCLDNILQGTNRIYELSVFRLAPQFVYAALAFLINYYMPLNLATALAAQFGVLVVVVGAMVYLLKPDFHGVRRQLASIWGANRRYGLQVYFGSLAGVATAHLGSITIAYFIDNTNVGFYGLALTITMPLTMIPNAVGATLFKDFADSHSISRKAALATLALSGAALLVFFAAIEKIVVLLYSEEFLGVVSLAYIMATGSILHGFGDFMNRFLGAHGRGGDLRNGAIAVGIVNVLGFLSLVGNFGVTGAAATKLCSGATYCMMMLAYYRRYRMQHLSAHAGK